MASKLLASYQDATSTTVDFTKAQNTSKLAPSMLTTGAYILEIKDAYLYKAASGSLQAMLLLNVYDVENPTNQVSEYKQRFTISQKDGRFTTNAGYPLVGLSNFLSIYSLTVKPVNNLGSTNLIDYPNNPNDPEKECERFADLVGKRFIGGIVMRKEFSYSNNGNTFTSPELLRIFNMDKKSMFEILSKDNSLGEYNKFLRAYPQDYVNDLTKGRTISNSFNTIDTVEKEVPKNTFISEPNDLTNTEIPF